MAVTVVLVLSLIYIEKYSEVKFLLTSVVVTIVLSHVAKLFFKRPRPDMHPPVITMPLDWSFHSAHTAQITALSLCVSVIALGYLPAIPAWSICVLALFVIGLVGFSRMYLQEHYPTDVAAGIVLVGFVVAFCQLLFKN